MSQTVQPSPEHGDLNLPLDLVARLCHQESKRYLQRDPHDPRYCYELFRRAIMARDQQAWSSLFTQYVEDTPLVPHWIKHHPLYSSSGEDVAYFANRAFEKMWSAVGPEKFARFSDLASLLRYLKLCVNSVITDYLRSRRLEDVPLQDADDATEDDSLERIHHQELWRLVQSRLNDEQERTAIYSRFAAGMKPREIYAQNGHIFADVKDVYRVLQNVLSRLRNDPALRAYVDLEN